MEQIGRLNVRVYTSQAQIPVDGATVVVTGTGQDSKRRLWAVRTTDRSGGTGPIVIPTPAASRSESPNGGQGYTQCEVWAEHPGFALVLVEGVQVFPGVETVQNIALSPLSEGENSLQKTQIRVIPSQSL